MSELIDPRSLRIGNLLEYDGKIVHVTMLSLDIDDEYQDTIGFCQFGKTSNEHADWNRAMVDKLRPIPLTPEWLEKFGFINTGDGEYKKEGFNQLADYGGQRIVLGNGAAYLECGYYENQIDCQYVHQLQDLFFALTGEELTIKETV